MDDVYSTRPSQSSRQIRACGRLSLAALLFLGLSHAAVSAPTETVEDALVVAPSVAPSPEALDHQVTRSEAANGEEVLVLTARLAAGLDSLIEDMHWTIRDSNGDIMHDATATEARLRLDPGTYIIDAINGETKVTEEIKVTRGESINFNFLLNAGQLRILPRVSNIPSLLGAKSTVYALSGVESGTLIGSTRKAGRIFDLPAGNYRIKTEYEFGNVTAVTDVRVRAGFMSAIDIDHVAGVVRLSHQGVSEGDVVWKLSTAEGEALPPITGTEAAVVLKPGRYDVEAQSSAGIQSASFEIKDGEERALALGN
jgi:hypothetical protein